MTTTTDKIWLTEREVVEQYPITRGGLQQRRVRGNGPRYSKRGHRVFYKRADVESWLREGLVKR